MKITDLLQDKRWKELFLKETIEYRVQIYEKNKPTGRYDSFTIIGLIRSYGEIFVFSRVKQAEGRKPGNKELFIFEELPEWIKKSISENILA